MKNLLQGFHSRFSSVSLLFVMVINIL